MIKRQNPKHKHITSFQIIILGFLSVIILGSILLMLPVATRVDFQSSLETTSLLKELDAKKIVSRAAREVHAKFLLRNGADEIVYPERQLADWTAIRYTADHILDYIELDSDHAIFEIAVPEKWIGKTVIEADVRKKHGINIMAIKRDGKMNLNFAPETSFIPGDTILVLGDTKNIQKCFHI